VAQERPRQVRSILLRHAAVAADATLTGAPIFRPSSGFRRVFREVIELTESFPKPVTDDVVHAADVIITMGCGDACPIFAGKRYEDWDVADPPANP
jgi:hypothetical protein